MLPPLGRESQAIAGAFLSCKAALSHLDEASLDHNARIWVETIRSAMDTRGIKDSSGIGTLELKAAVLSDDQRREFARAVDELANWVRYS